MSYSNIPLHLRGNAALWHERGPLLALFCSTKAPGSVILAAHDLAQQWRTGPTTLISGFHTPVEQECLTVLLRGPCPVILCPARGLEGMRLLPALKEPLAAGRLLLLSPFATTVRRVTASRAQQRNLLVAALADAVLIAHAPPGSKTEQVAREVLGWGKALYTLPDPANQSLLDLGAIPFPSDKAT